MTTTLLIFVIGALLGYGLGWLGTYVRTHTHRYNFDAPRGHRLSRTATFHTEADLDAWLAEQDDEDDVDDEHDTGWN